MTASQGPLPPVSTPWVDKLGTPSQAFRQYFLTLDVAVRALVTFINARFGASAPATLVSVATPSNANAATAGVLVGQLYRDTADPAKVYIRTI